VREKMMIVEKQMECRLTGETEVLGENLPQRHFCPSQKPHMTRPGFEPGPPWWCMLDLLFDFQNGAIKFFRNISKLLAMCAQRTNCGTTDLLS
jgi:hypothetical protein